MNASRFRCFALFTLLFVSFSPAFAAEGSGPKIDTIAWEPAKTVCEAWPEGISAKDARASGLTWIAYPASVKPFGMRSYVAIDAVTHPLRQIAYARQNDTLSLYYRTLGDRHYDVYLTLSGLEANALKGADLTGTLVAARFGIYSEIKITGSCGIDPPGG